MTANVDLAHSLRDLTRSLRAMEAGIRSVNQSMEALNREVYTNSTDRFLLDFDVFCDEAFQSAPWAGDDLRVAVASVLRATVVIVNEDIRNGVAFPMIALRTSRLHEVLDLLELHPARAAVTLLVAPMIDSVKAWVIDEFACRGWLLEDLAFEAGFWPAFAFSNGVNPRNWLTYEFTNSEGAANICELRFEDVAVRSVSWLGSPTRRVVALKMSNLLDGLDEPTRDTILCLVPEWQGSFGDLFAAGASLTVGQGSLVIGDLVLSREGMTAGLSRGSA